MLNFNILRMMNTAICFNDVMCVSTSNTLLFSLFFDIRFYLQKFEKNYKREEQETGGNVAVQTQFEYAYCLVRSEYPADIKKVCSSSKNSSSKRQFSFYLNFIQLNSIFAGHIFTGRSGTKTFGRQS